MTRKPDVRSSVLAARSSFWETLPQECGSRLTVRASVSEPDPTTSSLYDQLLQLKDWTEERAELCSGTPERERADTRVPSSAVSPEAQQESIASHEDTENCSREDSAMRLCEPHSGNVSRLAAVPAFHQGTVARVSSSSVKSARSSHSKRRSFSRSSFTATRSYETRLRRHRKRTFMMPELEPAHNTNTVLVLLETHAGMSDAMYMVASPSKRNTLLSMAASSWGKADHLMRSVMRRALYQGSEQAQSNNS